MRRLKKRFSAIMSLISEGSRNTRRLCSIAGVSPKCYYAHAKGASEKEMSDERLIAMIRALQETYGNSLGYRKMADRIKDDYGIVLGRKKVLRLMGDSVTVKDAKALDGMIMIVTFSNGEQRLFDATVLKEEVFEPLKNNDVFREFKIEFGTITWGDGEIDIAPEYLYKNSYKYNYPE